MASLWICKVYNFPEPLSTIRQPVEPFNNLYFMSISKQCCRQGVIIILCLTCIQCSATFIPLLHSTTVPFAVPCTSDVLRAASPLWPGDSVHGQSLLWVRTTSNNFHLSKRLISGPRANIGSKPYSPHGSVTMVQKQVPTLRRGRHNIQQDMIGCMCYFTKLQIPLFISEEVIIKFGSFNIFYFWNGMIYLKLLQIN